MAGLLTRPSVRSVAATSSTLVSRPYCVEIASYPSARSAGITLLKHEPSAQMPWANTMLGLVEDMVGSSARSDSRPKDADRRDRHGMAITAVSISRLHLPTHTDCSHWVGRRGPATRRSALGGGRIQSAQRGHPGNPDND